MSSSIDRRNFIKVVSIGTAASAAACTSEIPEKIIPHVVPPEDQIPGESLWYNSACMECGQACGIKLRNREGRVVKIEGNPDHQVSQGGVCLKGHTLLQATYHPDRLRAPQVDGKTSDWQSAINQVKTYLGQGGVAFLTAPLADSTARDLWQNAASTWGAKHFTWDPMYDAVADAAAETVFGKGTTVNYHLDAAKVIVAFGADFLSSWGNVVENQKGFSKARKPSKNGKMAKFIHVEPHLSLTAANADQWVQARPGTELWIAAAVLAGVIDSGNASGLSADEISQAKQLVSDVGYEKASTVSGISVDVIQGIVKSLSQLGSAVVLGGGAAANHSHATTLVAICQLLTKALGQQKTYSVYQNNSAPTDGQLQDLLAAIDAGDVKTVIVDRTNPVYSAPASWNVAEKLAKTNLVTFAAVPNETSQISKVVLADHTSIERWGDHWAPNGVHTIQQPGMNPLWDTRQSEQVLIELGVAAEKPLAAENFLQALQTKWQPLSDANGGWASVVQQGGVAAEPQTASQQTADLSKVNIAEAQRTGDGQLSLVVYPHAFRYDGRFSDRPWTQEVPDPLVQSTWSQWVEVHPKTAKKLGIKRGDLVEVKSETGAIQVHAYVSTSVHPDVVAIPLGQGRKDCGRYGSDVEGNAFTLLSATTDSVTATWVFGGNKVGVSKVADADIELITGTDLNLVTVDGAKHDHGRGIAPIIALESVRKINLGEEPFPAPPHHGTVIPDANAFYPPQDHPEERWGMVVDVNACIGCSACVASCYSENNIPIVGKRLIAKGREMSWIRIERYYDNDEANNSARFVPMFCQQCTNAPCEPVCPVFATYHTVDGLNGMVYNRCVGTRYCANNCSYKVRRFNYFGYDDVKQKEFAWPAPMDLMLNPDVTVRSAGVMEKCTFCVQRLREAKQTAKMNDQTSFEVTTACASSCPTDALSFGDLNNPDSDVSQVSKSNSRRYKILDVLNTQPAVTYLKKVHWTGKDKA